MSLFDAATITAMLRATGADEQVVISHNYGSVTLYADVRIGTQQVYLGEGEVTTLAPSVRVSTADIEAFIKPGELTKDGTFVTARDVNYRVSDHEHDGEGFSTLILTRAD